MKYSVKWDQAYADRNSDVLSTLVYSDINFIRHSTLKKISRERVLDMWTKKHPVVIRSQRVVYESD